MKLLFLFFLLICNYTATSQAIISFGYDGKGNRILRQINDLKAISDNSAINKNVTSISDLAFHIESSIRIHPNPTKGIFRVEVTKSEGKCITLVLADLNGKLLLEKEISEPSTTIDISDKSSGTYILRIKSGVENAEWKIIK